MRIIKKTIADMTDYYAESVMRWGGGEEVHAYLWWDKNSFWLWFEPTDNFESWCEEVMEKEHDDSLMHLLSDLREELNRIGVIPCGDLDSVNSVCKRYCGDNDPAYFYEDELLGICGA